MKKLCLTGVDYMRIGVFLAPLGDSRSQESGRPHAILGGPVLGMGRSSGPVLGAEHSHLPGPLFRPMYSLS